MTTRWKPKKGEHFWWLGGVLTTLAPVSDLWVDHWTDNSKYKAGNCFKTREQAEAALEKIKAVLMEVHDGGRDNT